MGITIRPLLPIETASGSDTTVIVVIVEFGQPVKSALEKHARIVTPFVGLDRPAGMYSAVAMPFASE